MAIVSGVLGVEIGGQSFACGDSAKYSAQNREYTSVTVGSGFGGVEGKGVSPFIEVTVFLGQGQSADSLRLRGGAVILNCEDRTVTLSQAWHTGKLEVDAAKNSLTVRYDGKSCIEVF